MGAASIPAGARTQDQVAVARKKPPKAPGTPWWLWLAVAAIVLFCLFPFYWLINISLKTPLDLRSSDFIPPNPTLDNYSQIFQNRDFTNALRNSAIVALSTTLLALAVGSFCAYALARLKLRFKFWILAVVLSISTFPQIAIAAPLFKLWSDVGLFNTHLGLIIPYLTFALPLAIYRLVAFFRESRGTSSRRPPSTAPRRSRPSARSSSRSPRPACSPRRSSSSSSPGTTSSSRTR